MSENSGSPSAVPPVYDRCALELWLSQLLRQVEMLKKKIEELEKSKKGE